jgi:hypothetical protein
VLLAWQDREKEGQVGIVAVQQIEPAEVQRIVSGNGSEIGVELVVALNKEVAVCIGKDACELAGQMV